MYHFPTQTLPQGSAQARVPEDPRSIQKPQNLLKRSQSTERKGIKLGYHSRKRGTSKEPEKEDQENTVRTDVKPNPLASSILSLSTSNRKFARSGLRQSSFKEEFEKFKSEKERTSPLKKPIEDFSAGEIRWLNELRSSMLAPGEKVNLLENEIINLLDANNELRSELTQTKSKYAALSMNVKKNQEWFQELQEIQMNLSMLKKPEEPVQERFGSSESQETFQLENIERTDDTKPQNEHEYLQTVMLKLREDNEKLYETIEKLQREKDEWKTQCEGLQERFKELRRTGADSLEEFSKEWLKTRTGENKKPNYQTAGLSREELEKRLDRITQYCAELSKVNRILDLENKIAVNHLVKLQRGGYNVELFTKATMPAQQQKKPEIKRRFKL